MQAGIVVVGDEILSGHTQDTNSTFLARGLAELGVDVVEIRTVPDGTTRIQGSVWELQERRDADLVVVAGGLGPTHDDRTVAALARLHAVPLVLHDETWARLTSRWRKRHPDGPEAPRGGQKMALVPEGAEVYQNEAGAAPGLLLSRLLVSRPGVAWTLVAPGVPRELTTLWEDHFRDRIRRLAGREARRRHVVELVYTGYESNIAHILDAVQNDSPDVTIGSYPRWGEGVVVLRVSGRDPKTVESTADRLLEQALTAGLSVTPAPGTPRKP